MNILFKLLVALVHGSALVVCSEALKRVQVDNSTLWVNAIVGINGVSVVECWGIQPPFVVSDQVSSSCLHIY